MSLWPFRDEPPAGALRGEAVQKVLEDVIGRRDLGLLATPYLALDTRILAMEEGRLRVRSALPPRTAQRTLAEQPLRLRLPWKLSMLAGPVGWLGSGEEEGNRWIQLEAPPWLLPDEQRAHPRVDLVGRSTFTLTSDALDQMRGGLENLSLGGALVYLREAPPAGLFQLGRTYELSLHLEEGPPVKLRVRAMHGDFQRLGLAFVQPPPAILAKLEAWLRPRHAEALRRWENYREIRAQAEAAARARAAAAQPEGVLAIGSPLFAAEMAEALEGVASSVRAGRPALAMLKGLLDRPPQLVVLQATTGGVEERHRLRGLWQSLNLGCPLVVVGTGEPGCAQAVGGELRAAGSLQWEGGRTRIFARLVHGLIQRAKGDEEEGGPAS